LHVRVVVMPALWLCSLSIDSRVFQERSVPQILQEVLEPRLAAHGRTLRLDLSGSYEPRDYCVQYRESDLDFATRLMEEEGIALRFDHAGEEEHEVLVLVDDNGSYPGVTTLDGLTEIPIIVDRSDNVDLESLQSFELRRRVHGTSVVRLDYDLQQPLDPIVHEATGADDRGLDRPHYQHMGRRFVLDDGQDLATREQQRHRVGGWVARGRSNVTGLHPGGVFEVFDHGHDAFNRKYLVTRVIHRGEQPEDPADARGPQYDNAYECIPHDVAYRPLHRTPRPRVEGPQTATVTGPSGEEIHTDELGRIKVFMHWDRLGARDDTSSCWVRVAQTWAGPSWGSMFIPRIGMEVLVEFLEGNPDRPLVTGCVYNGQNPPPYTLPDDKTKSTLKSNSSPGGDGYNELRFEDAAGAEEIWIHAQKDLNVKVLHNEDTTIDLHQTLQVGGNQTVTIDGNQIITVKGAPAQESGGGGGGGGGGFKGSSTDVTGDYKVTASKTAYISAPNSITLECPGSSIKLEPGKITLKAGGGAQIVLDGNALMKSSAGSSVLLDGNACVKSVAGSKVLLDGNALTQSSGGSKVLLDGNALVSAASGGSGFYDANATITGATTLCQSKSGGAIELTANAEMFGATAKVMGKGTAEVVGPTVNITGSGAVNVAGGSIKLN
ncbi:MAG: type VI secretion system tip protein VgrG, partial [Myxococcales bacterium]|nr:type VI secretion system tip protein VgrG [Myxococcales bacterium]